MQVLLSVLGFSQQVGERQRFEGAGAGGSGVPERVGVPRVPPAPDRAERPGPHAARGVDAVDADHRPDDRIVQSLKDKEQIHGLPLNATQTPLNRCFTLSRSDSVSSTSQELRRDSSRH